MTRVRCGRGIPDRRWIGAEIRAAHRRPAVRRPADSASIRERFIPGRAATGPARARAASPPPITAEAANQRRAARRRARCAMVAPQPWPTSRPDHLPRRATTAASVAATAEIAYCPGPRSRRSRAGQRRAGAAPDGRCAATLRHACGRLVKPCSSRTGRPVGAAPTQRDPPAGCANLLGRRPQAAGAGSRTEAATRTWSLADPTEDLCGDLRARRPRSRCSASSVSPSDAVAEHARHRRQRATAAGSTSDARPVVSTTALRARTTRLTRRARSALLLVADSSPAAAAPASTGSVAVVRRLGHRRRRSAAGAAAPPTRRRSGHRVRA